MTDNITVNIDATEPEIAVSLDELRYLVFRGMVGDSAYDIAVKLGFVGTEAEWLASLKGGKGDPGADGHSPFINQNGYWVFWNYQTNTWRVTNLKAEGTPGADGVSPTVQITEITRGHRVKITDAAHPQGQSFDVMDGEVEGAVRFDETQTLTAAQKEQARGNVGAVASDDLLTMLIPILRQGLYGTDQEAAISSLETALGGTPPVQTFFITNNLTNVTNSNDATAVNSGSAYTATLSALSGMAMQTVTITMGGVDVTSTVYSNGTISIPSVTGNIVITAVAESLIETYETTMSEGYVNPTNGSVGGTSTYKHTQIIPVREGDKVYGTAVRNSKVYNQIQARFVATYDQTDTIYSSAGSSTEKVYKESSPFVVPSGVYGIVFSISNSYPNEGVVVYVDKSERVGA